MTSSLSPRFVLPALVLLIAGAGSLLRFSGNDAGLRHHPTADERDFVENVGLMLHHGDLDHRYHQYPGLIFYVLYPVLAAHQPQPFDADAYRAVRGLAATFGVLSVVLTFFLARRLGGPVAGLGASAIVAISPIEVMSTYPFKPDVVLQTFCLVALLAFDRLRPALLPHAAAGVAMGLAMAVKFTGVLLLPIYGLRLLASHDSWRDCRWAGVAALASLVTFAAASPYTFLHWREAIAGAVTQVTYHYADSPASEAMRDVLGGYAERWLLYASILGTRGIGLLGTALVLAALWWDRHRWRRWIHLVAFPLLVVSVFATSSVKHDRFLLASLSSAAGLAGLGLACLATRAPRLTPLIAVATLAPLASISAGYVAERVRPETRDATLDFLADRAQAGDRVLTAVVDLGLDRERFDVITLTGSEERDRVLARNADWLVLLEEDRWIAEERGWSPAHVSRPTSPWSGLPIETFRVPADHRAQYSPIPIAEARLASSRSGHELARLRDGSRQTYWRTPGPQEPGDWIQVDLAEPAWLARVELDLGSRHHHYARGLDLLVSEDGQSFMKAQSVDKRPPMSEQLKAPRWPSQVLLLLEPRRVRAVRLVQTGVASKPWTLAELRLHAPEPAAP